MVAATLSPHPEVGSDDGTPPGARTVSPAGWDDDVRALLAQRVEAVSSGDANAWLATLAPDSTGHADEIEQLRALQGLPVTDFALILEASEQGHGTSSARVRVSYRLGSAPPAEHRDDVQVVATPHGWRLGESRPVVPVAAGGTVPAWYLPGVTAQPTAGGVVLVWPGTRGAGDHVARMTVTGLQRSRRAVPRGGTPDEPSAIAPPATVGLAGTARGTATAGVVVAMPDTAAAYRALVPGTAEAGSGFAAVTADVPGPADGDIVVINPDLWPGLDAAEQQVVLTHELVHVAVGATLGGGQPLWLAEGHADHVALAAVLSSGVTRRQLATAVLDRTAAAPLELPGTDDFASDAATAYPTAWLAVDYLVRAYGEQAVLDLLAHLAGAGQGVDAARTEDRVLQQVLKLDRAQFVEQWQRDLARIAVGSEPPGAAPESVE